MLSSIREKTEELGIHVTSKFVRHLINGNKKYQQIIRLGKKRKI